MISTGERNTQKHKDIARYRLDDNGPRWYFLLSEEEINVAKVPMIFKKRKTYWIKVNPCVSDGKSKNWFPCRY